MAVRRAAALVTCCLFALTGGPPGDGTAASILDGPPVPMRHTSRPLEAARSCSGSFEQRELPHTTAATGEISGFVGNGSGSAIEDLDGDSDLDIVLADVRGRASILWNRGRLSFRRQALATDDSRGISVVDVDSDGRRDIVLTRRASAPVLWRNQGGGDFEERALPGVSQRLYAIGWGDLDEDGDLDWAGGSYDNGLQQDLGYGFMRTREGAGVFVGLRSGGGYVVRRLTPGAQALTVGVWDVDAVGGPEVIVGNDFDEPDQVWTRRDGRWLRLQPFEQTAHSTMSLDFGDIDNDGSEELLATDMKPPQDDLGVRARWWPLMYRTPRVRFRGDRQVAENVLLARDDAEYENVAYERSLDATGWSWSGRFADLDQDGFLDLYVSNGMVADDMLEYLPGGELVERNIALRNLGDGTFEPAGSWGLSSEASGRGTAMDDLDADGDLDVVVNNVRFPALLFENRLCQGHSLLVDVAWPATANSSAVGAELVLHTDRGRYRRDVRVASGYLSAGPSQVHFGIPDDATPRHLEVRWPDGRVSELRDPGVDVRLRLVRRREPAPDRAR